LRDTERIDRMQRHAEPASSATGPGPRRLRNACLPYQRLRVETGQNNEVADATSVPAVKNEGELAGLYGGTVRELIRLLSPEDERRAEELYWQLKVDIARLVD